MCVRVCVCVCRYGWRGLMMDNMNEKKSINLHKVCACFVFVCLFVCLFVCCLCCLNA